MQFFPKSTVCIQFACKLDNFKIKSPEIVKFACKLDTNCTFAKKCIFHKLGKIEIRDQLTLFFLDFLIKICAALAPYLPNPEHEITTSHQPYTPYIHCTPPPTTHHTPPVIWWDLPTLPPPPHPHTPTPHPHPTIMMEAHHQKQ